MDWITNFWRSVFVCLLVSAGDSAIAGSPAWDAKRLGECRAAIKAGKGKETLSKLERLSQSKTSAIAREAAFLFADLSLSLKPQAEAKKAEQFLIVLSKPAVKDDWRNRAAIRLANHWSASGRHDAAVRHLDLILAENAYDAGAVRIGIALGDLHAGKQKLKEAARAYRFAHKLLVSLTDREGIDLKELQKKLAKAEKRPARPPKPAKEPQTTFAKAEKQRRAKKYKEAIELYRLVHTDYADHALAAPAGLRHGQCLLLSGKTALAQRQLRSFSKDSPKGAYRGHSQLLLGDIQLEYKFDIDAAEKIYLALFKTVTADDAGVDKTWQQVLPDVHDRLGLIKYFSREPKEAAKHFEESARLRPTKIFGDVPGQGMASLAEICRKGDPPLPKFLINEGKKQIRFALFLASAYMEGWKDDHSIKILHRVHSGDLKGLASFEQRAYALIREAEGHGHKDRNAEALKCYAAFEKKPYIRSRFTPDALLQIGCLHSRQARTAEAHKYLARVYKEHPKSEWAPWAMYQHAFSLYVLERDQEALDLFTRYKQKYHGHSKRRREHATEFIAELRERIRKAKRNKP